MNKVSCLVDERFVNPLFEVFDGGDLILSSYRDIEASQTTVQIFFEDGVEGRAAAIAQAQSALAAAMKIVGVDSPIEVGEIPDEDWKLSYRRHFQTERIGRRLVVRPPWEPEVAGEAVITLDPGLAFGTGKHETTRACLEYIEELSTELKGASFLDMGCGSGILSIAASKLGYQPVEGFDVDPEAVTAAGENVALNSAAADIFHFALGRAAVGKAGGERRPRPAQLVAANILAPLLVRFADEIAPLSPGYLIVSGILMPLYPEVLAAYVTRGYREVSQRNYGEWTTGLLRCVSA